MRQNKRLVNISLCNFILHLAQIDRRFDAQQIIKQYVKYDLLDVKLSDIDFLAQRRGKVAPIIPQDDHAVESIDHKLL
jgi:hypothetical protein